MIKTKLTIMLTALLMLFCMSANAQNSIKGDVTGDGKVDNADIEKVVEMIVTGDTKNAKGDVNKDNVVNVADIVSIVNIIKTPVGNPAITFGVNIINKTGQDVTLDGDLEFVLGNPDHNGYYLGWNGSYNNTDGGIRFSDEAVTIPAGDSKQFDNLTWKDDGVDGTGMGIGEKSPANANQLVAAGRPKNVLVYVNGNPDIVTCENMPTSIVFKEGEVYDIILSSAKSLTGGNPVISFGVNIKNNTGREVTLDGDLYFVLGNPDHNGNYMGWEGMYNKTGHIRFSDSAVTFAVDETKEYRGLTWEDEGNGLGEKSPIDPSLLSYTGYHHNVAVYVGKSGEEVYCENLPSDIVFTQGGVYTIILTGFDSTPEPENPVIPVTPVNPGAGNPVINIGVKITNTRSSAVTLDGRLRFVLGNPDHNGTYFGGWTGGFYIRTDNIWFSNGSVTLGPGESRIYNNLSWKDEDTGCGLGETSPLSPNYLPIYNDEGGIAYARNVLIYTGGRSDLILCDNLSENTVFQEGVTYNLVIR